MAITNTDYLAALRTVLSATLRPITSFDYNGGPRYSDGSRYMRDPEHMVSHDNLFAPSCGSWVEFKDIHEEDFIYPVGDGTFRDYTVMRMSASCTCGEYTDQDAVADMIIRGYGDIEVAFRKEQRSLS